MTILADGALAGRVAFVTGGSMGLGRSIAVCLAGYGATVVAAARSDGIHETVDRVTEVTGDDSRALAVECDVSDESAVESAIDGTVETFGGLDVLVNNAGIAGPTAPVEEVGVESFEETLRVNLVGAFLCAKHASPHLRASDHGRIVNVSSVGGKRPYANRTPYASSKMGMIGLSRALAAEFGDDAVTVNAICPGPVSGDRIDRVMQAQADRRGWSLERAKQELLLDDLTIEELVEPADVAEQVAFLASDAGRHVTTQDVNVDSGMTWY